MDKQLNYQLWINNKDTHLKMKNKTNKQKAVEIAHGNGYIVQRSITSGRDTHQTANWTKPRSTLMIQLYERLQQYTLL